MLQLLRIHQWIKNLLLFVPIFFSGQIQDVDLFLQILIAFLSYSLMASAVYILNDYVDIERDKLHPTKQFRP
ncbi:MAG: prenyltransferase, partial [Saprospiraceae bacterium]